MSYRVASFVTFRVYVTVQNSPLPWYSGGEGKSAFRPAPLFDICHLLFAIDFLREKNYTALALLEFSVRSKNMYYRVSQ